MTALREWLAFLWHQHCRLAMKIDAGGWWAMAWYAVGLFACVASLFADGAGGWALSAVGWACIGMGVANECGYIHS